VPCIGFALFFHNVLSVAAQDVTVVGTQKETNEKIRSLGESYKTSPHEYTIGSGDLLSISVFDVPELTKDVRVSQNGTISMPLVPTRLHVSGLTEVQAEQMIADVLESNGLVTHPEVGVSVKEHRSRPITIVGAVQHPMVYEADGGVTLLEALAEAGGITNDAGDTIIVTRSRAASFVPVATTAPLSEPAPAPGAASSTTAAPADHNSAPSLDTNSSGPSNSLGAFPAGDQNSAATADSQATQSGNLITISLNDLLESGDTRNNISLQAGDVVTVPHAGIVYVLGAVYKPGGFILSTDRAQLTTMKVLSLAGGNTKVAKMDHAVIIRKDGQGKQTETSVDLAKVLKFQSEDLQMRASDILYIPESTAKAALLQTIQIAVAVATAVAIYRVSYH
jgi:polysaccharide export outer membrane protein